jgi:AraC-like DNA-binding protein
MLTSQRLFSTCGVSLTLFQCDGGHTIWSSEEELTEFAVVLVRSGAFRRRADGRETFVEPLVGYLERPGAIQQVAHPFGGDVCTVIGLPEATIDSIVDSSTWPAGTMLHIEPAADVAHRLLLNRIREGGDPQELLERIISLAGRIVGSEPNRLEAARLTVASYRRLANGVREALREDLDLALPALAARLGSSMYQVSRAFRFATGLTVSRYRMRLRTLRALDRLAEGETNLASVAVESGFSDQAHMTRVLNRETAMTPRRLRDLLKTTHAL